MTSVKIAKSKNFRLVLKVEPCFVSSPKDLQQREMMHMAWSLFSERIYERIQMTKMLPKQVVADTTQTKTRSTMLARRSSKDEMPSVLGLQLRT